MYNSFLPNSQSQYVSCYEYVGKTVWGQRTVININVSTGCQALEIKAWFAILLVKDHPFITKGIVSLGHQWVNEMWSPLLRDRKHTIATMQPTPLGNGPRLLSSLRPQRMQRGPPGGWSKGNATVCYPDSGTGMSAGYGC